jgi:guanidinopropionase
MVADPDAEGQMADESPYLLPVDSGQVARFVDIATFMRAPAMDDLDRVDVALYGIPFDLGLAYRPGSRHAPAAVREASRAIRRVNPTTGVNPFTAAQVADVGDVVCHPYDYDGAIEAMEAFARRLREHGVRGVACGGDHVVTLPLLRGLHADEPVGVIQFDSHSDTLDTFYGRSVTHATSMRRAVEEGIVDPRRCVQVGLRGTLWDGHDFDYALEAGMRCITYDEYEALGRDAVIDEIRRVVGDGPAYVTWDVDGLDPVHAPGTAVLEPGGISMRDAQVMLRSLTGLHVVGGDVVEVSPPLDPTGVTVHNAANLMFEILCLVAETVRRGRAG